MSAVVPDGMRVSDADREAAAAELADHYATGRLDAEEHEARLTAVWAARTGSDLARLFTDLPRAGVRPAPARTPGGRRAPARAAGPGRPPRALAPVLLVVTVVLSVVTGWPLFWVGLAALLFAGGRGCHR